MGSLGVSKYKRQDGSKVNKVRPSKHWVDCFGWSCRETLESQMTRQECGLIQSGPGDAGGSQVEQQRATEGQRPRLSWQSPYLVLMRPRIQCTTVPILGMMIHICNANIPEVGA